MTKPRVSSSIDVPVILFREDPAYFDEMLAASRYFVITTEREAIPSHSLVIPRYSLLPFPESLHNSTLLKESYLVDSLESHRYMSNIDAWYPYLKSKTFPTYALDKVPSGIPVVMKGKTNSRKHNWDDMMFAQSQEDRSRILRKLLDDELIAGQGIVAREYIPLYRYDTGIHGMPVTAEFRFFFFDLNLVDAGFYWGSFSEYQQQAEDMFLDKCELLARSVASICFDAQGCRFIVVDVAITKDKEEPILVEINDGSMSGLGTIDPNRFYRNLRRNVP